MTSDEAEYTGETLREEIDEETDGLPLRERYGIVLLLILAAYVVAGFDQGRWVLVVNSFLWVTVLLTTLWSPGIPRVLRRVGLAATALVLFSALTVGVFASATADGYRLLLLAVAQFAAILAILHRILRHRTVTIQTVMGGISAYALIAFVMSSIYFGLDLMTDQEFLNGVVDNGDYTYFSFVTLTTVGYGDILAASNLAKRLVVIEAFVGQVFIITFVARLVSLWGKPLKPEPGRG
ncbi:MAG TPA: ion channel [Acidimicrobiia bacterium]|nr:ion channel [Acidimicrobiia bacterium]